MNHADKHAAFRAQLEDAIYNKHAGGTVPSRYIATSMLDAIMPIIEVYCAEQAIAASAATAAFIDHANRDVLPAMEKSALSVSIGSEKPDAKLCLEFGAAILFDKPMIIVAAPGQKIPANVKRVATRIIFGDVRDPRTAKELNAAIQSVIENDERAKK